MHKTKQITFSTRDMGFFRAPLRHGNYCLVALTVQVLETAHYISKLLRHPHFNTRAKRNGKVIRVSTQKITLGRWGGSDRSSPIGKRLASSSSNKVFLHRFSRLTLHRITLSARPSTFCGIVTPICLAVLRLITSSNFFGCSTGISAGLAPFKILSTYQATRR